jgi:G3E family GTPase
MTTSFGASVQKDTRIPVTILTGFLGAGKTTLLNHLIKKYPEKKFAVIENEFGEINIDSQLVVNTDGNIFELSNGCICCALNEDLVNLLYELLDSKKEFNHLIIETTGIADPGAVALNFITDYGIQQHFRLDGMIALADASNLSTQLEETEEAAKQLAIADLIVLNKVSLAGTEKTQEAEALIRSINSGAQLCRCDYAQPEGYNLLDLQAFSAKMVMATDFEGPAQAPAPLLKPVATVHSDIISVSVVHEGIINPLMFDNWMTVLLLSSNIYRVKGILNMYSFDRRFVFQAVGSQFVSELGTDWGEEARLNKIVFIGKKLDRKVIEEGFKKCLADL